MNDYTSLQRVGMVNSVLSYLMEADTHNSRIIAHTSNIEMSKMHEELQNKINECIGDISTIIEKYNLYEQEHVSYKVMSE